MAENQNPGSDADQNDGLDKANAKLQKQFDSLTADNVRQQSEIEQFKRQVSSLTSDRDTLATANQKLQADYDEKVSELTIAENLIEQQTAQLKTAEVGQALGPVVVTHEKEQYRVLVPRFSHAGNLVEAATLRQNPDLVRQLVEGGSGLLQKIEAASA